MEARRQAELEARRQREAEHQRMLEEQKRRAEEQREMARSGSIHYPGCSFSSSFCLHLLPQTKYVSLSRLSPADCLILGAFCRLGGHFFDLYCKCFGSLFTLTLLPSRSSPTVANTDGFVKSKISSQQCRICAFF